VVYDDATSSNKEYELEVDDLQNQSDNNEEHISNGTVVFLFLL